MKGESEPRPGHCRGTRHVRSQRQRFPSRENHSSKGEAARKAKYQPELRK